MVDYSNSSSQYQNVFLINPYNRSSAWPVHPWTTRGPTRVLLLRRRIANMSSLIGSNNSHSWAATEQCIILSRVFAEHTRADQTIRNIRRSRIDATRVSLGYSNCWFISVIVYVCPWLCLGCGMNAARIVHHEFVNSITDCRYQNKTKTVSSCPRKVVFLPYLCFLAFRVQIERFLLSVYCYLGLLLFGNPSNLLLHRAIIVYLFQWMSWQVILRKHSLWGVMVLYWVI